MIGPAEKKAPIRIAGYLEKRGKMKLLVGRWKRWWFVLEGRLLLYYKSQLEYLNLSPCRGSLNMGLAASVCPGKALELIVVTRSQTVTLRAGNKVDHEQWLQSLVDAMALPHSINMNITSRPVMHFRYSQDHHEHIIQRIKNFKSPTYSALTKTNTTTPSSNSCETSTSSSQDSAFAQPTSQRDKSVLRRVFSDSRTLLRRPCKRSASAVCSPRRLSKIAFSDTSIPVSAQETCVLQEHATDKCQSLQDLSNNQCESHENAIEKDKSNNTEPKIADTERTISGSKDSKLSNSIKIELNLEDITDTKVSGSVREQKIGNIKIVLDGCAIYGSTELSRVDTNGNCKTGEKLKNPEYVDNKRLNLQLCNGKDVRSDTDLSIRRKTRGHSMSCENMQTLDRSIGSTFHDTSVRVEVVGREQRISNIAEPASRKTNKKRSQSILSRFRDNKTDSDGSTLERRGTIKKRLSFLRKVWKKRERKTEEEDFDSADYESIPVVIELPSPEVEKASDLLLVLDCPKPQACPEPEPPPDYDVSITEEVEVPPVLPPRLRQRPASPWHDVPTNNRPVEPPQVDDPPPLPMKRRKQTAHQVLIKISDQSSSVEQSQSQSLGDESVQCAPPSSTGGRLEDLDTLLAQLAEVNTYVVNQIDFGDNMVQVSAATGEREEPIYDVPRPHGSLLASLRSQHVRSENFAPTHFLCTTPVVDVDSLDPANRLEAEITPDSLECGSLWSLGEARRSDSSHSGSGSGSLTRHFITADDKLFPDSLNT